MRCRRRLGQGITRNPALVRLGADGGGRSRGLGSADGRIRPGCGERCGPSLEGGVVPGSSTGTPVSPAATPRARWTPGSTTTPGSSPPPGSSGSSSTTGRTIASASSTEVLRGGGRQVRRPRPHHPGRARLSQPECSTSSTTALLGPGAVGGRAVRPPQGPSRLCV